MTMTLYGSLPSPHVMRPLLAARAKGHELALGAFEGGIKSDACLALSPMGKMPLLVDGDLALPETQVIVDYLDDVLPGPKLVPADPREAARARLIARLFDIYIVPAMAGLFRDREIPEAVAAAKATTGEALGWIEHFRREGDRWAVGESFTVADAALIPFIFFLDAMDAMTGTRVLIEARPSLAAWWAHAKASELGGWAIAEQDAAFRAFLAAAR